MVFFFRYKIYKATLLLHRGSKMKGRNIENRNDILILSLLEQNKIIQIREKRNNRFVPLNKISHISCEGYLAIIFTTTGERYCVSRSLKQLEPVLFDYGFVRVNRSTIVNILHTTSCIFGEYPSITTNNIDVFPISRRRVKWVNNSFRKYEANHS
jgi:DNA-binding LytR/AlgR family response regulator